MDFLVRQTIGEAGSETTDRVVTAKILRLGGDFKNDIVIPGLDANLKVAVSGAEVQLRSSRKNILVDGVLRRRVTLNAEQMVTVSGLQIGLFPAPSGFDVGLNLSGRVDPTEKLMREMRADAAPWSNRRLSWLLAILVLAFTFGLPYWGIKDQTVKQVVAQAGLPSDNHWSSGPLSEAHRAAGIEFTCESCHQDEFIMVQDAPCLACHQTIREHADTELHAMLNLEQIRCASCHREHNEPVSLNPTNNALCVDCHAESQSWARGKVAHSDVRAFAPERHPQFKVAAPKLIDTEWHYERVLVTEANGADGSGLKFDHQVHMNPEKVSFDRSGKPLVCSNCHSLEPEGEHFAPIQMESHCAECHSLAFDPLTPDFQLPHSRARDVYKVLEGHFMRQFTELELLRDTEAARRLPNQTKAMLACDDNPLVCAKEAAAREARYQFQDTGCVTCHTVSDLRGDNPALRYQVNPVMQQSDWYPKAYFDHRAHAEIGERFGDEVCADCHAASESASAADVLMPAIEGCFDCHNADRSDVAVDCVSCHWFHQDSGPRSALLRAENRLRNPNADAWIYQWLDK